MPIPHADTALQRLFASTDRSGGSDACWPWTGAINSSGYGVLEIGSRTDGSRRLARAHVLTYRLAYGAPPPDKPCILHTCDNPPCCNPRHLWTGTVADNQADMASKGRARGPRGEKQGNAKLCEADIRAIRAAARTTSGADLARQYGVSRSTICLILKRRNWAHLA